VKEKYGSSYNVLSLNKVPKELKAIQTDMEEALNKKEEKKEK